MWKLVAALGLLSAASGVAHAQVVHHTLGYPGVPDTAGPIPDPTLRFELGAGVDIGNFSFAKLDGMAFGGDVSGGIRAGAWSALANVSWQAAMFDGGYVNGPMTTWASARRDELLGRWAFHSGRNVMTAKHDHSRVVGINRADEWLELGVGREHDVLHTGGDASRGLVSVGLGLTSSNNGDGWHNGGNLVVRVIRASDPDTGVVDHEVVVSLGASFGS